MKRFRIPSLPRLVAITLLVVGTTTPLISVSRAIALNTERLGLGACTKCGCNSYVGLGNACERATCRHKDTAHR